MPSNKSAVKRMKQSLLKRQRNRRVKSYIKNAVHKFFVYLRKEDKEKAKQAYTKASSVIDKAVSKGVIHKKNAARKKSRLAQKLNKLVS